MDCPALLTELDAQNERIRRVYGRPLIPPDGARSQDFAVALEKSGGAYEGPRAPGHWSGYRMELWYSCTPEQRQHAFAMACWEIYGQRLEDERRQKFWDELAGDAGEGEDMKPPS